MILPAVQPVLLEIALAGNAGAEDFRQAIHVHGLDAEASFKIAPQRLAPRLGTKSAAAQRKRRDIDAHSIRHFGDVECVGRRRAQDGRAEIPHQHDLPLGAAARHRDDGAAEPLGAVVGAEAAGEEAVTVGIVNDVAGPGTDAR